MNKRKELDFDDVRDDFTPEAQDDELRDLAQITEYLELKRKLALVRKAGLADSKTPNAINGALGLAEARIRFLDGAYTILNSNNAEIKAMRRALVSKGKSEIEAAKVIAKELVKRGRFDKIKTAIGPTFVNEVNKNSAFS